MNKRDYKKLYNKYKSKYLLLTKSSNNSYLIKEIDEVNESPTQVDWPSISNKVRNSVVQIYSLEYEINPKYPYIQPRDKLARGSGFIIYSDKNKILIMTNSHVIENSKKIYVRTEQTQNNDINASVIGICPSKDLAIIMIKEDINMFKKLPQALEFKDDRTYQDSIPVMVVGYPLGKENIKFTTGVLSGNQSEFTIEYDRFTSYLQISAAVNPGNSGGPLINSKGEVIGVNSAGYTFTQSIAYAIPSHIIITVLEDLLKNKPVVNVFNYGFKWNNSSNELLAKYGNLDKSGIYIYKTNVENVLKLKENDILHKIEFFDICNKVNIWNDILFENKIICNDDDKLIAVIDNYGIIKIFTNSNCDEEHIWSKNRKININELLDSIINNSKLILHVTRENKLIQLKVEAENIPVDGIGSILPSYKPLEWEICMGCCFTPLVVPLIQMTQKKSNILQEDDFDEDSEDLSYFLQDKYRNKNWIALTHIFPESDSYKSYILKKNEIGVITHINNKEITTMDELRNFLINLKDKYITIDFENGKRLVISNENKKIQKQDKLIYENNKIKFTDFALKWTK